MKPWPPSCPSGSKRTCLTTLPLRIDFDQSPGVALGDERIAVRQTLAGVDLALRLVGKDNLPLSIHLLHAMARDKQQVAIRKHPQVVALRGGVLPLDLALCREEHDLAAAVVTAGEGVASSLFDRRRLRGAGLASRDR